MWGKQSVLSAVVFLLVLGGSACGAHRARSAAYEDGYGHGPDAFEAAPLLKNGVLARRPEIARACAKVASFRLVPYADRREWVAGCVAGAASLAK